MVVRVFEGADSCEYSQFYGESANVFGFDDAGSSRRLDDADDDDNDHGTE